MTLELAHDRRDRIGGELRAALQVEAVDRLDQADRRDLDEVLELLAAPGVAPRERLGERKVVLDQPLAGSEVTTLVVGAQELSVRALGPGAHLVPFQWNWH